MLHRQWEKSLRHYFDRTMIITVITVRVVEMAIDKIVNVVAVRNCFMSAAGSVDVAVIV